jgi:hypothetical protein
MKFKELKQGQEFKVNDIIYKYCSFYQSLQSQDDEYPAILCPLCYASRFWISYGNYECIANCDCGHKMVIYDG